MKTRFVWESRFTTKLGHYNSSIQIKQQTMINSMEWNEIYTVLVFRQTYVNCWSIYSSKVQYSLSLEFHPLLIICGVYTFNKIYQNIIESSVICWSSSMLNYGNKLMIYIKICHGPPGIELHEKPEILYQLWKITCLWFTFMLMFNDLYPLFICYIAIEHGT